jgi:type II secretory ATPase GspE/PulE/Tfp pilus assembly ATPase PilB-like protein
VNEFIKNLPSLQSSCPIADKEISLKAKSLALCSSREARAYFEYETALELKILPLALVSSSSNKQLRIAIAEGSEADLCKKASFICGITVVACTLNEAILLKAIETSYKTDDEWLGQNLNGLKSVDASNPLQIEIHDLSESEPVPKALKVLLEYAIARDASDIHLIPSVSGLCLKLRVRGELLNYKQAICSESISARLVSRIKILSKLRTDLKAVPQDGSFSIKLRSGSRQIRVSTMPTIHGEKCVLRITSKAADYSLSNLGFSQASFEIAAECLRQKEGLILVSGATGSGKTTTLYAFVQELVKLNLNVVSIEDPVEAEIEGVSQTSLDCNRGLDYSTALKAILRQDPDCIMVGEIRDAASAKLCLSAALSGHLVLSSLHASNCRESILRLSEFGCDLPSLTASLKLLINQSLVQRLCSRCKVIDLLGSNRHGFKVFKAVGCAECEYSGFDSRLIALERFYCLKSNKNINLLSKTEAEWEEQQEFESKMHYLEKYIREGLISKTI